jgi:hypothetical protein
MIDNMHYLPSGLTDQGDYYLKYGPDLEAIKLDCQSIKDANHPQWSYTLVENDELDQFGL